MRLSRLALLSALALSGVSIFTLPAAAQVTLKVWSIDGVNQPGIADTLSKEFDDASLCGRSHGSDWKAAGAASGCRGS